MAKRTGETPKAKERPEREPKGHLRGSGPWIEARIAGHLRETYRKLDPFVRRDEPHAYACTGKDAHVAARAARDVQAVLHVLYESFDGIAGRAALRKEWSLRARLALREEGRNLDDIPRGAPLHACWVAALIDSGDLPAPKVSRESQRNAAANVYTMLIKKRSPIRDYLRDRWSNPGSHSTNTRRILRAEGDDDQRDGIGVRSKDERRLGYELGKKALEWRGESVVRKALAIAGYKRPDNLFRS